MRRFTVPLILAIALIVASCGKQHRAGHGVYMLLDTSGTYTKELKVAQLLIAATLATLNPGDSFAVARIDTGSFSEKDIVARVTFDDRPSVANQQKRLFKETVDRFIKDVKSSSYTDITGGLLQAAEYLNEKNPGRKTVLIFSDMKEDIQPGYVRKGLELKLEDFEIVAMNVTKLGSDNIDPREYSSRLDAWQNRVEKGGGAWRVINDLDNFDSILR
jgi:hypothetical protein